MGFYDTSFALNGQLHHNGIDPRLPTLGRPGFNFQQSFISQLLNVIAAINGSEQLLVPGEQGLRSLKLIEHCYRHRSLMAMPWLNEEEQLAALRLKGY
jgi:hypothetical protein